MRERGYEPAEVQRVFVGKTQDRAAVIRLCDPQRRVRLRLAVEATGEPTLEFLDADGRVVYRLPDSAERQERAPQA